MKPSPLRKLRDYTTTDQAELARQLVQLEDNIDDMGASLAKVAAAQLERRGPLATTDAALAPGQFQAFDTRQGARNVTLVKPTAGDVGKFTIVLDVGGGAANITLRPSGCLLRAASATIAQYAALLFCDGVDYWRVF